MGDLSVAVLVVVILAAFLFIKRITDVIDVQDNKIKFNEFYAQNDDIVDDPDAISKKIIPDGVEVYEINGQFFFGVADIDEALAITDEILADIMQ